MNEPEFKNWVKAAYGFKYLRSGLLSFVSNQVGQKYRLLKLEVAKQYPNVQPCDVCTSENLLPDHGSGVCIQRNCFCSKASHTRRKCPNNFCSYFYHLIVTDHVEKNPRWSSTDPRQWYNDVFQYAKCFLGTHSPANSINDIDCTGLLSIVINNRHLHQLVADIGLFKKCRNDRNKIFHSANYQVTGQELTTYIDDMVGVLEVKLINDQKAREMVTRLNELKNDKIVITDIGIVGLNSVIQDSLSAINELRDGVKQDIEHRRKQFMKEFDKHYANLIHAIEMREQEASSKIDKHGDEAIREIGIHRDESLCKIDKHGDEAVSKIGIHRDGSLSKIDKHGDEAISEIGIHRDESLSKIDKHGDETIKKINNLRDDIASKNDGHGNEASCGFYIPASSGKKSCKGMIICTTL